MLPILSHRKMQIYPTFQFHLTSIRMAIVRKTNDNKFWQVCSQRGTLIH